MARKKKPPTTVRPAPKPLKYAKIPPGKAVPRSYTFARLNRMAAKGQIDDSVIEKIIEREGEWQTNGSFWYESTIDVWKAALTSLGLTNIEINFSGFWSQGGGASFTGRVSYMETFLKFMGTEVEPDSCIGCEDGVENFVPWLWHKAKACVADPKYLALLPIVEDLVLEFERIDSHYYHDNTVSTSFESNSCDYSLDPLVSELRETVDELRSDWSCAIYKDLEDEYEYLTDQDNIVTYLREAEIKLTIEGDRA